MSRLQWQPVQATGAFNPVEALNTSGKMFDRASNTVDRMTKNALQGDIITSNILDTQLDDQQKQMRIGDYALTDQEKQLPDHMLLEMIKNGQGIESIDTGNRNDVARFNELGSMYGSQLEGQRQTALSAISDSYNKELAIEQAKGYSPEDFALVEAQLKSKYAEPIANINRQFTMGARGLDANPSNVSSNYSMSLDQFGRPQWNPNQQGPAGQPLEASPARQALMGNQPQVAPAELQAPQDTSVAPQSVPFAAPNGAPLNANGTNVPTPGTVSTNPHNAKTYSEVSETSPFSKITDPVQRVNVMGFLDAISKAEGADYNSLVGKGAFNTEIADLSAHPNKVGLRTKDGPSTAAGKYQITGTTWKSLSHGGASDFSEDSQDAAAIELLKRRGAYEMVLNGDFEGAVKKLGNEWQGLPSGKSKNQGKRSWEEFNGYLQDSLAARGGSPQQQGQTNPNDIAAITEEWASGRRGEQLGDVGTPGQLPNEGYSESARNLADVLGEDYGRKSITPEQMLTEANSKVSIDPLNYDSTANVFKRTMDDLKVQVEPVKQLDAASLKTAIDTLATELGIKPDVARAQLFNTANKYGGLTESELYEIALKTPAVGNGPLDDTFDEVALKRNIEAAKINKASRAKTQGNLEDIQSKFSALDVTFKASNAAVAKEMEYLNEVARKGGSAAVINASQNRLNKAMKSRDSAQRDLEKVMTEGNKIYSKYMTEIKEERADVEKNMPQSQRDALFRELTDQEALPGDAAAITGKSDRLNDYTVPRYPENPVQERERRYEGMSQTEKNRAKVLETNPLVEYVRGKQNEIYIRDLESKDKDSTYGIVNGETKRYKRSDLGSVINGGSGVAQKWGINFSHLPKRFNEEE